MSNRFKERGSGNPRNLMYAELSTLLSMSRWHKQVSPHIDPPTGLGLEYPVHNDPEAFTVQILRSIDERSANLDDFGRKQCLFHKKGRAVDDSIYKVRIYRFSLECIGFRGLCELLMCIHEVHVCRRTYTIFAVRGASSTLRTRYA
jgi:hypothetical protein